MSIDQNIVRKIFFCALLVSLVLFAGCSSSEEAEKPVSAPSATAMIQKQLNDLKAENSTLKQQLEKAQQDNRAATARVAELETQLSIAKERPVVSTPEERPVPIRTPRVSGGGESAYEEGLNLYRQKNYREALEKFEAVAGDDGAGGFADRGAYWSGECQFALKNYDGALESFQRVLGFRQSTKKDDAQMMLGNCYLAMGNKSKAKAEFKKLVTNFPASPYVPRAKAKMKNL